MTYPASRLLPSQAEAGMSREMTIAANHARSYAASLRRGAVSSTTFYNCASQMKSLIDLIDRAEATGGLDDYSATAYPDVDAAAERQKVRAAAVAVRDWIVDADAGKSMAGSFKSDGSRKYAAFAPAATEPLAVLLDALAAEIE